MITVHPVDKKQLIAHPEVQFTLHGREYSVHAFMLPESGLERICENIRNTRKSVLYYKSPDSSYTFVAAGEIGLPSEGGRNFPFEFASSVHHNSLQQGIELPAKLPLVIHTLPFTETRGGMWKDFSFAPYIPEAIYFCDGETTILVCFSSPSEFLGIARDGRERHPVTGNPALSENDFDLIPDQSLDRWTAKVNLIKEKIASGEIIKAVLSRRFEMRLPDEFNFESLLSGLSRFESTHRFLFRQGDSVFTGASPERLLSYYAHTVYTEALAGTALRGETEAEDAENTDALLSSEKELNEHQIVVDHIVQALQKTAKGVFYNKQPFVKKLTTLMHLWTPVAASPIESEQMFELIDTLFPTPATCGTPRESVYPLIGDLEEYERGLYSGLIGWITAAGNAEFFVPLRSALINDNKAQLFAGGGIVAGSEAENEFYETLRKAEAIASLLKI